MKTITFLFLAALMYSASCFAQPSQWYVAINPAKLDSLLGPSRRQLGWHRIGSPEAPMIDGTTDSVWTKASSSQSTFDRYIKEVTTKLGDSYKVESLLSNGINSKRLPENAQDFSGFFRTMFDDDYFYLYYDITDDQVNSEESNSGYFSSREASSFIKLSYISSEIVGASCTW